MKMPAWLQTRWDRMTEKARFNQVVIYNQLIASPRTTPKKKEWARERLKALGETPMEDEPFDAD